MNGLSGISPCVYHCGRTIRSRTLKNYTISSENCNVFIFCLKGSALHQVGGRTRLLTRGTAEIVPPFLHQVIQTTSDSDTEIFYLYFDLFERPNHTLPHTKPIRSEVPQTELYFMENPGYKNLEAQYDSMLQLIENMERACADASPLRELKRKALMLEMLHAFLLADPIEEAGVFSSADRHVERAMRYIEHHCADVSLCAKHVAAYMALHPDHLSRLFVKCIHMSLSHYIRQVRINRAKELFFCHKKVGQVALLCGFTSVQSFSRTFHQVEGMSPTEYLTQMT